MTIVAHAPFRIPQPVRYEARAPVDLPDAACRDLGPDLFYPRGTSGPALEQITAAKAICAGCPERQACLDHALTNDERHGIWGGTTEEERDQIRRSRAS